MKWMYNSLLYASNVIPHMQLFMIIVNAVLRKILHNAIYTVIPWTQAYLENLGKTNINTRRHIYLVIKISFITFKFDDMLKWHIHVYLYILYIKPCWWGFLRFWSRFKWISMYLIMCKVCLFLYRSLKKETVWYYPLLQNYDFKTFIDCLYNVCSTWFHC